MNRAGRYADASPLISIDIIDVAGALKHAWARSGALPSCVHLKTDAEWNAGDLGCGQLVLDLRKRLRAMPGGVLKVIALDIGAPEDLPAWCRLTHNELIAHDPDTKSFWIRSRQDWG